MQKWLKIIPLLLMISLLLNDFAIAQKDPVKADSTKYYKKIEAFSKRKKFRYFLYTLIFKPQVIIKKKKKVNTKIKSETYIAFDGKTIRHIFIETLDPFGYSLTDVSIAPQNYFFKKANMVHVKSKRITILNLLLIRKNQIFDSLLYKESERLIRSQGYVREVLFSVKLTSKNSDSVDVNIRELDKWSIMPQAVFSNSQLSVKIKDKNFMGMGHEFQNSFTWYHTTGENAYNTNYIIPNIVNTYISTTLNYSKDRYGNTSKSFGIYRPFYSTFTKWAGGIYFSNQFIFDSLNSGDSLFIFQKIKFNINDYWAGYAFRIFKGNSVNNRTTNLISAFRFYSIEFLEKPIQMFDTLNKYSTENFYLASIGISTRKYVQDKYVFKFGVFEDVPIGKNYSVTVGYQERNNINRLYVGGRISIGNFYHWGYFSTNFEYGTFFNKSKAEQGIFKASVNYVTKLFKVGKWYFRQFAKPQITIGLNRFSYESLSINDGYGIDGFNSSLLSGSSRMLFTFQSQSYAPWNLLGFRFGPYFIYSIGVLGDVRTSFKGSKMYSQFGLGILIKNDNLVLNTFQISFSFYPIIPETGNGLLKINSFRTADFGFKDFEMGKPAAIMYQ